MIPVSSRSPVSLAQGKTLGTSLRPWGMHGIACVSGWAERRRSRHIPSRVKPANNSLHGFATKTQALAREIPSATRLFADPLSFATRSRLRYQNRRDLVFRKKTRSNRSTRARNPACYAGYAWQARRVILMSALRSSRSYHLQFLYNPYGTFLWCYQKKSRKKISHKDEQGPQFALLKVVSSFPVFH